LLLSAGAHAARRTPALPSIDISCPQGCSAANPPAVVAVVDRRDRQSDGRSTVTWYIDPAPHTMLAAPINWDFWGSLFFNKQNLVR